MVVEEVVLGFGLGVSTAAATTVLDLVVRNATLSCASADPSKGWVSAAG